MPADTTQIGKIKTYRAQLLICAGTGCVSNRSFKVRDALVEEIKKRDLVEEVQVVATGCQGFCAQGPIIIVQPDGIFYQMLTVDDVPLLVEEHLVKGRPVEKLMYIPSKGKPPIPKLNDIAFFSKQRLIVLKNRGLIDPEKIDEYIARDGYQALAKVLTSMTPEQVQRSVGHATESTVSVLFPVLLGLACTSVISGEPKPALPNALRSTVTSYHTSYIQSG